MSDYVNPRAHACQNCVKAKAKCYDLTDGRCERYECPIRDAIPNVNAKTALI